VSDEGLHGLTEITISPARLWRRKKKNPTSIDQKKKERNRF